MVGGKTGAIFRPPGPAKALRPCYFGSEERGWRHAFAPNEVDIAPADEPARAAYDRDFYTWLLEQARLLREGRFEAVDRENVAEEIESLGEQFNKLSSAFRILLVHMLEWDHPPDLRSPSGTLSVKEQRMEVQDLLDDNPALKSRLEEALARGYRKARLQAARVAEDRFPAACPYSVEEITSRRFDSPKEPDRA